MAMRTLLQRRWDSVVITASVLATLATLFGTAARPALAAQGGFERTLKVTGPVELSVTTGSGRIEVSKGGASTVIVRGSIHASSGWGLSAEERVRQIESNPPIEQDGNVIRVGRFRDRGLEHNVSIAFEVVVPAETRLHAETGSGEEVIRGLRGPVDAGTGSGNLTVSNIGDDVKAETGSGDIRLSSIQGRAHVGTGSGSIRGSELTGGLWAETGSGTIEVHGVRGGLRAATGSGRITAEGAPGSEWKLNAGSGNIDVRLPAHTGFDLYAKADSGRVSVDRPISMQGTLGRNEVHGKADGGGPLVDVRSGSGNIHIE